MSLKSRLQISKILVKLVGFKDKKKYSTLICSKDIITNVEVY
jgi:hypothetical protein